MTVLASRERLDGPAKALEEAATRTLCIPADRAALRRCLGKPLSHPMVQPAHRIVAPLLPFPQGVDRDDLPPAARVDLDAIERAFYTVAALIASQGREARDDHLGVTSVDGVVADRADDATGGTVSESSPEVPGGVADEAPMELTTRRERRRSLGHAVADTVKTAPLQDQENLSRRMDARLRLVCRQDLDGVHRHLPRFIRYLRAEFVAVDIDWVRLTVDLARWGTAADTVAKTWLQNYYRKVLKSTTASADDTESEA